MPTASPDDLDTHDDGAASQREQFLISIPDAERLSLQSRFVRNRFEAEILGDIETRIRSGTLLDPSAVPGDLVTMNSRVVLREVETGRQYVFSLVFPCSADSPKGRVSALTPLGSILLGARTGQTLTCPVAGVIVKVVVEAILHQPEAAGDYYG